MESAALATQLDAIREQGRIYLESLNIAEHPFAVLDIIIVAAILYWAFRFVRGTKAASIVAGVLVVGAIFLIGRIFELDAVNWLLRVLVPVLLVAIPVVFQPELRRALERIGRGQPWKTRLTSTRRRAASLAHEIVSALSTLAQTNTGALLVIERRTGLAEDTEHATRLDARVSTPLLLNLFFPKSPLHDGALVIRGERIAAAGVTLPLSDAVETYQLGTRHKAALGISEVSDALAFVVSEERGTIGVAFNGTLYQKVSLERVRSVLEASYAGATGKELQTLLAQ